MKFLQNMVESFRGLHTVLLEPLNAKVLDGSAEAVKAGLNPGRLNGHSMVGVVGRGLVYHLLRGSHESAKSDTPGASHHEDGMLKHMNEGNLV